MRLFEGCLTGEICWFCQSITKINKIIAQGLPSIIQVCSNSHQNVFKIQN